MQHRREMIIEQLTSTEELRQINEVSNSIRNDIRTFNQNQIEQTIEKNKSMERLT